MNTVTKLTFLIIALLLTATQVQAGGEKGKKEKLQYNPPELAGPNYAKYHPGKDRIYLLDGGISGGFYNSMPKGKNKKEELLIKFPEPEHVYEIFPKDIRNFYQLPNLEVPLIASLEFVGDSMYVGGKECIYGYDLNTSSTFIKLENDSLIFLDAWFDNNNTIYYLAYHEVPDNYISTLFSLDITSNTFTDMNLSEEQIGNASSMLFDEENNRLLFVIKEDSSSIAQYDLNSSSFSIIRQTTINNLEDFTWGEDGYIYCLNWNENTQKGGSSYFRVKDDFSGDFEEIRTCNKGQELLYYVATEDYILTESWGFLTKMQPLFREPVLTYPADGATNVEQCVAFEWEWDKNAYEYLLQVATDPNFNQLIIDSTVYPFLAVFNLQVKNLQVIDSLSLGETYYWRIMPQNFYFDGNWSDSRTFTTSSSYTQGPNIIEPHPDSTRQKNYLKYSWNSVPGAESYLVLLTSGDALYQSHLTTDTSIVLSELYYFFIYDLRVKVASGSGAGIWSESRTFTVKEEPIKSPWIQYPYYESEGIENSVEVSWYGDNNASYYEVMIQPFWSDEWRYFQVDSNSIFIDSLMLRTYYTIRVRGMNSVDIGNWEYQTFSTADSLVNPPGLINPGGSGDVNLEWEDTGADWYVLQVAEPDKEFDETKELIQAGKPIPYYLLNPVIKEELLENNKIVLGQNDLKDRTKYIWRVRSVKDSNNSKWSEIKSFETNFSTAVEDERNDNNYLNIYPNPASSKTNVEFYASVQSEIIIDIYNLMGTNVRTYSLGLLEHGYHNYDINLENLPDGIYYIVMKNSSKSTVQKLILMR